MKMFVMILTLALAAGTMRAENGAKAVFEAGDFAGAAGQLEPALAAAAPSAEGYYNLGLAREKAGDAPAAILNYRRALLLDPGLEPARQAFALLAARQSIPVPPRGWMDDLQRVAHPETWLLVGTFVAWAGAFGLLFAARARRGRGVRVALALLGLVGGCAATAVGWLTDARAASARPALVKGAEAVDVMSAPADNSNLIVSLPAGAAVGVISPRGAWTYVDLAGGAKGWVQSDRLEPIVPGETF